MLPNSRSHVFKNLAAQLPLQLALDAGCRAAHPLTEVALAEEEEELPILVQAALLFPEQLLMTRCVVLELTTW